jgi:hypothetical protein
VLRAVVARSAGTTAAGSDDDANVTTATDADFAAAATAAGRDRKSTAADDTAAIAAAVETAGRDRESTAADDAAREAAPDAPADRRQSAADDDAGTATDHDAHAVDIVEGSALDGLQGERRLHGRDQSRVRTEGDVQSAAAVQVRVPGERVAREADHRRDI